MAKLNEMHPLLPSCAWEGFYTYATGPQADKHKMSCNLTFRKGKVSGGGTDDVSSFSWKGTYDLDSLVCTLTKHYPTHTVKYAGQVDENGIWGTWSLGTKSGGFHIWPKSKKEQGLKEEKETAKKQLSKKLQRKA
jgi:hypothetical protein